ncbi:hypothetical protein [Xanthomonas arboricola]|uniref:hypothetical protein n=1 Tax=Xanthomonas arboricola TaxID=56448 RepID=UPI000464931C|nr:hypothetical protein [Xanthomonas arboricola]
MGINIFEGARRIALIVAGISIIVALVLAAMNEPYLSMQYRVVSPTLPPIRSNDSCPYDAGRHYFTTRTPQGRVVGIELCLVAMQFGKEPNMLIPYEVDKAGMVWGAEAFSKEVDDYERALERRFVLPDRDGQWADHEVSRRYGDNWRKTLIGLTIGLGIFWIVVWAVGWVVRGFARIPRGKDGRVGE